jgi:hypothetical protein
MLYLASVYIMGSHIVYKPLFIFKSSVKSIGQCIFNVYVKSPISAQVDMYSNIKILCCELI